MNSEREQKIMFTNTWSAHDIVDWWIDPEGGNYSSEISTPEDPKTHVYRYCEIDLDYHMAYLLRIHRNDTPVDYLAVFKRHGGPGCYDVEWRNEPHPFFHNPNGRWKLWEAMQWFLQWTEGRAEYHAGCEHCHDWNPDG